MVFSTTVRQIFITVAPQFVALSLGGSLGYPCVLLEQLKLEDSSIRPSLDSMSWIASMHGIAGVGSAMMPIIMQIIGRKFSFIVSCLVLIIGWSLAFLANNVYIILLAEFFLGLGCNCTVIVNLITVSEMLAPKYRNPSMMLLGISQTIGMLLVTLVGTLMHWKSMALIMCSFIVIALIMISLWPESPSWLLYKGKFDECEKAFTWLRGSDDHAKRELQALIVAQREDAKKLTKTSTWQDIGEKFRMKDFYMPALHMLLVLLNIYFSGLVCLFIYSKEVMENGSGDEKAAAFGFVLMDLILLIGAIISLIFVRYLNTKTILYIGATCHMFLIAGAMVSYLQHLHVIPKNSWLFIYCFLGYVACNCSGFNTITFAIAVDLMPVKHRGIGGALFNIITCFLHFSTVKLLPYLILYLNVWGTFMLFSLCGIMFTLLIWKYVPETKGRTLQEIEDYYNYGSFVIKRDFEDNVDVATLIFKIKC